MLRFPKERIIMNTTPILPGEPFSEEKTQQIVEQFHRDGFVHIPGVLTPKEITALRDTTDRLFADPSLAERTNPSPRRYEIHPVEAA